MTGGKGPPARAAPGAASSRRRRGIMASRSRLRASARACRARSWCGCALVRTALGSHARIIGVQAANADAFARSWRGPSRVVGDTAATFAEGMATRVTFDFTFEILKRELDDIVTLTEDELADGVRL